MILNVTVRLVGWWVGSLELVGRSVGGRVGQSVSRVGWVGSVCQRWLGLSVAQCSGRLSSFRSIFSAHCSLFPFPVSRFPVPVPSEIPSNYS